MIVGVGIDVVETARVAAALDRTQRLAVRLFTERERGLPPWSLAARAGVARWHVSLSHDAGLATAVVIAEGGAD